MSLVRKVELALRIWWLALSLRVRTRLTPLPRVIAEIGAVDETRRRYPMNPVSLGRVVVRVLTVAGRPPRCLISAMVAFRLLRLEGRSVELVIGLPNAPTDKDAHAWLELEGVDIGPPPGRHGHVELTRYG
jgi:hypothetical protein